MEPTQTFANELADIDVTTIEKKAFLLSPQQQAWIDYKALGGIIFDKDNGVFEHWTAERFATYIGVDRRTLYNWRDSIPSFWDRVAERRKELNAGEWLAELHKKWKLKAMKFDNWQITEAWLINFDKNYKTPKIKVEHDVGDSYAALLAAAVRDGILEGELVDEHQQANSTTSPSN